MNENEIKTAYAVFNDYWKLTKEFSAAESSEEFWTRFKEASGALLDKHGRTEFSGAMCYAVTSLIMMTERRKSACS